MTEDLESECRKALAKDQDVCVWRVFGPLFVLSHYNTNRTHDDWVTSCGNHHEFYYCDSDPQDAGFKFCPFCGKKIEVQK